MGTSNREPQENSRNERTSESIFLLRSCYILGVPGFGAHFEVSIMVSSWLKTLPNAKAAINSKLTNVRLTAGCENYAKLSGICSQLCRLSANK